MLKYFRTFGKFRKQSKKSNLYFGCWYKFYNSYFVNLGVFVNFVTLEFWDFCIYISRYVDACLVFKRQSGLCRNRFKMYIKKLHHYTYLCKSERGNAEGSAERSYFGPWVRWVQGGLLVLSVCLF